MNVIKTVVNSLYIQSHGIVHGELDSVAKNGGRGGEGKGGEGRRA